MKQLENNVICKYCLGCNKLLVESFNGVKNCKNFIEGDNDWANKFIKAIKGEKNV